jgi:hypothetical protein
MITVVLSAWADPLPPANVAPVRTEVPAAESASLDADDPRFSGPPDYAETRCRSLSPDVLWIHVTSLGGAALGSRWTLDVDGATLVRAQLLGEQIPTDRSFVVVDVQSERVLRPFRQVGSVERRAQVVRLTTLDGQPITAALDAPFTWVCERTSLPPQPTRR